MTTVKILATVRSTDNGDGSNSMSFYNTYQELLDELREDGWDEDKIADLEEGNDPYELGTISKVTIEFNLDTGTIVPFSVSSDG